jgi:hypothetical protein
MKFGGDQKGVETFKQIIRKKGSRERYLKRIAVRGLVTPPPDDVVGFLRGNRTERKHPLT